MILKVTRMGSKTYWRSLRKHRGHRSHHCFGWIVRRRGINFNTNRDWNSGYDGRPLWGRWCHYHTFDDHRNRRWSLWRRRPFWKLKYQHHFYHYDDFHALSFWWVRY